MSRLEELIQELCPNGVEYKPLWFLTIWDKKFNSVDRHKQTKVIKYKYYLAADLKRLESQTGDVKILTTSISDLWTTEEYVKDTMSEGEIVCIPWGGNPVVQYYSGKFVTGDNRIATSANTSVLSNKFLYYFMQNRISDIASFYRGSGIKHPDMAKVLDLMIPVPPLEVQREIVRILDSFTLLTAELTAELTARKKQYEYYQNALMDFTDRNVQYKSVGELFEIKNGLNKQKDAFGKGQPIINFTDVYNKRWLAKGTFKGLVDVTEEEIKRYSAKKGDVFFTRTSETKEDIGMSSTLIEDIPNCVFSGFVLRARPITDLLLPKFCSYYFSTNKVRDTIIRYAAFTTRATTTGPKLSKIMVPILSIEEQQRIVKILDRFDSLCNDITTGLPAEIEARQKQYEFYRDKLLSFKQL